MTAATTKADFKQQQAEWNQQVEQLKQELVTRLNQVQTKAEFAEIMQIVQLHPHRSFRNALLIEEAHAQAAIQGRVPQGPTTKVATYKEWEKIGRHVNKGQTGYAIIQPVKSKFWKDPSGTAHRVTKDQPAPEGSNVFTRTTAWRPGYVFDFSQTSGKEYTPTPGVELQPLEGKADPNIARAVENLLNLKYDGVQTPQTNQELRDYITRYASDLTNNQPVSVYRPSPETGKGQEKVTLTANPDLDNLRAWVAAAGICSVLGIPTPTNWGTDVLPIPKIDGVEHGKLLASLCEATKRTITTGIQQISTEAGIENPFTQPRLTPGTPTITQEQENQTMRENLLIKTMNSAHRGTEIEVDQRLTQPWDEFLKDYIEVRLDEMQDNNQTVYGCALADEITMPINMDGSYFIWTAKTEEFIKNHWDEAGDFYQDYVEHFDEPPASVFTEPDKFHVQMMILGIEQVMDQSSFVQEHWNEEIQLTGENCRQILTELGIKPSEPEAHLTPHPSITQEGPEL